MPRWLVRGFPTVLVVASAAALGLTGMTAVFLATGFVTVTPDCVAGHRAHPSPLTLFGDACVNPPGYMPWMVVFGAIGAALGLTMALSVIRLFGRIRSGRRQCHLAP